jgi:hypothetical protein
MVVFAVLEALCWSLSFRVKAKDFRGDENAIKPVKEGKNQKRQNYKSKPIHSAPPSIF